MSLIRIQKTGDRYAVSAVAIHTPQGKKLIPNPMGSEVYVFDSLEAAQDAVLRAGFDAEFEGRRLYQESRGLAPSAVSPASHPGDVLREALPALLRMLEDKESGAVTNAVLALGELGVLSPEPEVIQRLCGLLGHEDATVRRHVAEALAKTGPMCERPLKQAWDDARRRPDKQTPYVCMTILLAALQLMQFRSHVPQHLLPLALDGLKDESWLVRAQAALVVGQAAVLAQAV